MSLGRRLLEAREKDDRTLAEIEDGMRIQAYHPVRKENILFVLDHIAETYEATRYKTYSPKETQYTYQFSNGAVIIAQFPVNGIMYVGECEEFSRGKSEVDGYSTNAHLIFLGFEQTPHIIQEVKGLLELKEKI